MMNADVREFFRLQFDCLIRNRGAIIHLDVQDYVQDDFIDELVLETDIINIDFGDSTCMN